MDTAATNLRKATGAFTEALNHVFGPALALGRTVADSGLRDAEGDRLTDLFFGLATGPVRQFEQMNGVFLGFPDGRFLQVQDLDLAGDTEGGMDVGTDGIIPRRRIIDHPADDPSGRWESYDPTNRLWRPVARVTAAYDPRTRPWYGAAVKAGKPIWTDAYVFASSGKLGVTYAEPLYDNSGALWAVLGVDLSLGSLSRTMVQTAGALAEIGDVVFATDIADRVLGHPDFVELAEDMDRDTLRFLERYREPKSLESTLVRELKQTDVVETVDVGGHSFLTTKAVLDPRRGMPLQIYLARDLDVVLAKAFEARQRNVVLVFLAVVVVAVVAVYVVKLRVEVTARERAEAELIDAKEVAEAATRAKSTFLATMSHEIRTPMNGVMSMAELLGLTRLDGEQRRMAKIINDSAMALLTIINDILDFSKIEAGKLEIERVGFSLMDVVDGSAELLAPRAEAKGLDLIVAIDPHLVDRRLGDPTRIRQILLNLGGNAVKFTEHGRIGLRVTAADSAAPTLRFEVSDTGIGLTTEQRGRLFQAFVQADTSTARKYGGTGLGLSICQRLAELMDGRIGVDSTVGEGSVFWFELPLDPDGSAPPHYPGDLSEVRAGLAGLPEAVAALTDGYLRATGIDAVTVRPDLRDAEPGEADLWIVAATLPDLDAASLERLDATIAFAGRRAELAALSPDLKARASTLLTLPLSRPTLWRAAAIALGLEVPDDVSVETREDMAFAPPDTEQARGANALVLVAEDNETNQVVIRQMLGRMGFACEIAANGRIALSMLERPGYGLLLTDVNMPELDGYQLARAIRDREADGAERLPILALTADALVGTDEACLAAGMDGYLTKPVDSRKLSATLIERLPQALPLRRSAPDPTSAGDAGTPPNRAAPTWDPDIFDPEVLGGPSGELDPEARDLIVNASASWVGKIADINAALAGGDAKKARDVTHSLKGATLSVGANRLGRIASDIQDSLDADQIDMALLLAEALQPTLDELQATLPTILNH